MKPYFSDITAECWVRSRLGTTKECFCLQADSLACDVFLTAVSELEQEGPPAQRKITLAGRKHSRSIGSLRLVLSQQSDQLKEMFLRQETDTAVLEFTPPGLVEFKRCIVELKKGRQDFSLHPDLYKTKKEDRGELDEKSIELWFWTPYMDP